MSRLASGCSAPTTTSGVDTAAPAVAGIAPMATHPPTGPKPTPPGNLILWKSRVSQSIPAEERKPIHIGRVLQSASHPSARRSQSGLVEGLFHRLPLGRIQRGNGGAARADRFAKKRQGGLHAPRRRAQVQRQAQRMKARLRRPRPRAVARLEFLVNLDKQLGGDCVPAMMMVRVMIVATGR